MNNSLNDTNTKELSILDLSCGEGTIIVPLSKIFKNITAIDSSYKMLEILKNKLELKKVGSTNINENNENNKNEKINKQKL